MRDYYVIASRDCGTNTLVYETGKTTFHGDIYMGNVLEAKRFESLAEVCDYIKNSGSKFYLGCSIINIADVTFEKLKESLEGDKKLYAKFHDPNYAIK